ncbi:MAG: MOSC N-terminal beta barrel domain-containing protein, partial [Ktedonobacterales bacterium]
MRLGTVRQVWCYPVKSLRGEPLDEASVSARGLAHDRRYALLDPATGKVGSAKHPRLWGRLLACQARMLEDGLCIAMPDGRDVRLGRDDVDAALSHL